MEGQRITLVTEDVDCMELLIAGRKAGALEELEVSVDLFPITRSGCRDWALSSKDTELLERLRKRIQGSVLSHQHVAIAICNIPAIGEARFWPPRDPKKGASPNVKMPPSDATIQYHFYAINATTGARSWRAIGSAAAVSSSPAVANGVVFVGSGDGNLCAFDAAAS